MLLSAPHGAQSMYRYREMRSAFVEGWSDVVFGFSGLFDPESICHWPGCSMGMVMKCICSMSGDSNCLIEAWQAMEMFRTVGNIAKWMPLGEIDH